MQFHCILQKEPAALTTVALAFRKKLDEIVTRALAKDREARYQTIKELALDLKRLRRSWMSRRKSSVPERPNCATGVPAP
jgi:hypothetical protein